MALEIFWFSGSGFAWRVLLAAELKGIDYASRLIEASAGDHRTPEFVAMNPRGKVPVLRDGDVVVTESLAIIAYLDRLFPDPPLFGRTPEEMAQIWRFALDFDNYAAARFSDFVLPIYFDAVATSRAQIDAALDDVLRELATLEARLDGRPWLADEYLSAADIAIYPFVEGLLRAAGKPAAASLDLSYMPFGDTHPALAAWRQRIIALPGYESAYPPHWRDAA